MFTVWMIVINTTFWLVVCFGLAYGVRLIPRSFYEKNTWVFHERSYEKRFYKKIQLSLWKDKLPEWGNVFNFEKKNLHTELNKEYLNKFILETYYAEVGHIGMGIVGFACIVVNPEGFTRFALICSSVNLVVQIPFCLIQRYNRPRLIRLRDKFTDRGA
ncbi:hypothetical protein [Bacillus sp. N1-1]|jgi:glycosyl-4,4'-diaponeurosporenoate acyltransferase|uniref:glycosyl-4,4'-diaponeurosporenoate acyltransferase CrtO family protein n=1 Tax=Bacillus sp. N1-1 TaxID=2682541 RepID=UPI00131730EB|nr:hypothetical protein [Bacillus sp. N1-1]QHA91008.1 hypothetical protein GNK04_06005 [Bacillus sp. N1-1]